MGNLKLIFLLLFLCGFGISTVAAEETEETEDLARVRGVVKCEIPYTPTGDVIIPLVGCVIQMFYEREGVLDSLYTVSSVDGGSFSFKGIPAQRVVLRLRRLGYETRSGVYELGPGDNFFVFTMKEQAEDLEESKVTAEIPLMKQLKDTTIYNTRAIKSIEGEGLREVLEQIPGFRITDTDIYVNGEKVSRTYVNGVLIFGDEAINAVNALKANEVTQVKVYDEQSEIDKRRGKKNSRKERVLDVVTTDKFVSLSQMGIAAVGGMDGLGKGRYGGVASASFDSEMLNMEASVWGLNLPQPNNLSFSPSSIHTFTSFDFPLQEYSESERAEFILTKHWKNRHFGNSLYFTYGYDHDYTRSESSSQTEYFASETEPAMLQTDSLMSMSAFSRHCASFLLSLMDTPLKSFVITGFAAFSGSRTSDEDISKRETEATQTYSRHEFDRSDERNFELRGSMRWSNNDSGKWRPTLGIYGSFKRNTMLSWTVDTLETSFLQRNLTGDGYGNSIFAGGRAGADFTLLNEEKQTLDVNFYASAEYNNNRSLKLTLNEWDVQVPVTDIANSYDYTRNDLTVKAVGEVAYSTAADLHISGEISLNGKTMLNDERYPEDYYNRKTFIYPEFKFNIKLPEWQFVSSLSTTTPSVEQISSRISDTNPLILTGGNSDLKQSHLLSAGVTWRPKLEPGKRRQPRTLSISLNGSGTFNPIATRMIYFDTDTALDRWDGYQAKAGSILYTSSNASRPSWNAGVKGDYSTRIFRNRINLVAGVFSNYGQASQFSGENLLWIGELRSGMNLNFIYPIARKIKLVEAPTFTYLTSRDNIGDALSSRIVVSNRVYATWFILPRLQLTVTHSLRWYNYLHGVGHNHFSQLLDVKLTALLLKDKSLRVSIHGGDLLNSGTQYETQLNASYMTQRWIPTYGRCFLATVAYVFRKKK